MNHTGVRRLSLGALMGAVLAPAGCARDLGDDLVIASSWPVSERTALEVAFHRWVARTPGSTSGPIRIGWVVLGPCDDPIRVVRRRPPIDILLGGSASSFKRLARSGALGPSEGDGKALWRVARRAPIGLAMNPSQHDNGPIFDDPRHDAVTLAWARSRLVAGDWFEGYARLVRDAGHARRIRRQPGAALAAVARGEAERAPAVDSGDEGRKTPLRFVAPHLAVEWVEGIALLAEGRHRGAAREFLQFLAERGEAEALPPGSPDPPDIDGLLSDLLGATLVDAQDELGAAWSSMDRVGRPSSAEAWLTEPPPWPPASVEALRSRRESEPLMATLAAELAPDPDVRAWLLQSWRRPSRPIDVELLDDLAVAVGGRLAREPRFRAWLRAEWTAWARQRYRQVAEKPGEVPP